MNDQASGETQLKTLNILGIRMRCLSYEDAYPIYDQWLQDKKGPSHSLAVINVHICVSALFSKKLRDMVSNADLVEIDSMPFLYLARAFVNRKSDRFYAPDLMLEVMGKSKEKGYSHCLYGGYPGAPEKIEQYLRQQVGEVNIVGKFSPPFRELTAEEDQEICDRINQIQPDFLWIGLGSPKQDVWIDAHREKIKGCILVPSGATFDFFSGKIKQAPLWVRRSGFEWLFRLFHDFKRLWVRYVVYNLIFCLVLFLQLIRVITFDHQGYMRLFGARTRLGNRD